MHSFAATSSGLAIHYIIFILLLFQEKVSSATPCQKIPAGLKKMARGVDITKVSPLPLDFTEVDGYVSLVVDFTCDQGKTWTNPYDKVTYQLPDQVAAMISVPGGWENVRTSLFTSNSDVKRDMATEVGVDLFKGMFSASASHKYMQQVITNKKKVVTDAHVFLSTTEGIFKPGFALGLNKDAQLLMDQLPDSFYENPGLYYKFISYFGTHYFTRGKFGGYVRQYFEMDQSYYYQKSDLYVKAQAKASFMKFFSGTFSTSVSSTSVDSDFTRNTQSHFIHYGGDRYILDDKGVLEWQPTLQEKPWLFGGSVKPIYDMINNTAKRESMKQAVRAYLDRAYLEELETLLNTVEHKSGFEALEEKLTAQKLHLIPQQNVVAQLGVEIEDISDQPPSWWLSVQLCFSFQYESYQSWSWSWSTSSHPSCTGLGGYTSYLSDFSHSSSKTNLRTSWILKASPTEEWFTKAEICMKYRQSPGADGNQCNKGISLAELCAPVNSYTPDYYDNTDDRAGGCLLSWQLRVPPGSPKWLLRTQLCFQWWEAGSRPYTGMCGLGSNSTLCAFANEWTPEYLDDSDSRNDRCYMRWGLTDSRMITPAESQI